MEVNKARRLKELERENTELKKMLAEALLKTGYWSSHAKKSSELSVSHPAVARSTYGYQGRTASSAEQQMRKRLHELSAAHPRYGYRRIAALLRRDGWRDCGCRRPSGRSCGEASPRDCPHGRPIAGTYGRGTSLPTRPHEGRSVADADDPG